MGIRNFLSAVPPWKCQTSAAKMPTCVTCLPGIEDGSVCLWGEGLGRSLGWWVEAKQGPMANSSYIWSCTDQGFCRCSSFYRNHHIFDCSPHWQLGHCAPHRVPGEGSICPEFQKIVASILWLQKPRKKKTRRTSMWANLWIDTCIFHGFLFCPCHQKQRQRHLKVQQRPGQRCRLRQRWAQDAPNACCDTGRHLRWICGQKLGNPQLNGGL